MNCRKRERNVSLLLNPLKVDEPSVNIRANQLHANTVAHVNPLKSMHQPPFDRHIKKANPGAFGCCTGDNGIEPFPDP
jgi:hypothetical protein